MIKFSTVNFSNYNITNFKNTVKQTPAYIGKLQADSVSFSGTRATKTNQKKMVVCAKEAKEQIEIFRTIFGSEEDFQKEYDRMRELAQQHKVDGKFCTFPDDEYELEPLFQGTVMLCSTIDKSKKKNNIEYEYAMILNNKPNKSNCIIAYTKTDSKNKQVSGTIFCDIKDGHFERINFLNNKRYDIMEFDEKGNLSKFNFTDVSEVV